MQQTEHEEVALDFVLQWLFLPEVFPFHSDHQRTQTAFALPCNPSPESDTL
jgi:hypothetical protein